MERAGVYHVLSTQCMPALCARHRNGNATMQGMSNILYRNCITIILMKETPVKNYNFYSCMWSSFAVICYFIVCHLQACAPCSLWLRKHQACIPLAIALVPDPYSWETCSQTQRGSEPLQYMLEFLRCQLASLEQLKFSLTILRTSSYFQGSVSFSLFECNCR